MIPLPYYVATLAVVLAFTFIVGYAMGRGWLDTDDDRNKIGDF